jgi:hypothetical protein
MLKEEGVLEEERRHKDGRDLYFNAEHCYSHYTLNSLNALTSVVSMPVPLLPMSRSLSRSNPLLD